MPSQKRFTPNPNKKRIVKNYDNLPDAIVAQLKLEYPYGFAQHLVNYQNKEGKKVSALPYETEDVYYLIRMTVSEAEEIIEADDDYDDDGNLRDDYSIEEDIEKMANDIPDDAEDED